MDDPTAPPNQTVWPAQAPNEPAASPVMQPMNTIASAPSSQPTQSFHGQPMAMGGVPQQVVYIPLSYTPQPNYRTWSYVAIGLAIVGAFFGTFLGIAFNQPVLGEALNSLLCCGGFTAAVFLDVAYYKGKADWQSANGMSNTGSVVSMVIEALVGVLCVLLLVFAFINLASRI
ncbi:MAG: hypothetical protein VX151_02255 [Candidatus Thermoplasmatota archaeon]|nr:hypothetical protein [Candidatus Thermoplasmatota archaeon]